MKTVPILVPDLELPQRVTRISVWHSRHGAKVEEGEPLVELIVDAAAVELSCPAPGILRQAALEDDIVQAGQVIGNIRLID